MKIIIVHSTTNAEIVININAISHIDLDRNEVHMTNGEILWINGIDIREKILGI